MPKLNFSVLLGLSTTAVLSTSLPAKSFDFSTVQYIDTRPLEYNSFLSFYGDTSTNQGFSAYFNLDPTAPDAGHIEISLNSPGNPAPYYASGYDYSPEEPPTGATRSASLLGSTGFTNFANYLSSNSISLDDIGFSFGPKNGDFTKTWNLGDDLQNQDWFASPTTTLEERIYQANPEDVEIVLLYENTKFISFGYSDIYSFLEYGATPDVIDDTEAIIANPFKPFKADGLDPFTSGLADAFLSDVRSQGGWIQFISEDEGVVPDEITFGNGYGIANIRFPVELRIVSVPEPSVVVGLVTLGLMGVARRTKSNLSKQNKKTL